MDPSVLVSKLVSSQGFMPLFVYLTLASSLANLVITSIYSSFVIIIKLDGIPQGLGGTNCTSGGVLEVLAASVCEVSIYAPFSVASTVSSCPPCGNIPTIKFAAFRAYQTKGFVACLIRPKSVVLVASIISSIAGRSKTLTARHIYVIK